MKIMIDIGHPAHVHYFRNFIEIMISKGHEFLITSRNKEIEHYLLDNYKIAFCDRGKGRKSVIGKILYIFEADYILLKEAKKFKPDILLSFDSLYLSHISKMINVPHIALDDTEHSKFEHMLSFPFTKTILTPTCYNLDLGKKQIFFNGYMELSYLHRNYFTPDKSILDQINIKENDRYIIMRFVSWNASHDIGHSGINFEMKYKIIKELSKYARIFISSESELPDNLKQYRITVSPEKIHHLLAYSTLFIGEGATMASECAMLGTPSIYVNSLEVGYCTELEKKYSLIYGFRNTEGVLEKAIELLENKDLKTIFETRRQKMLSEKIDVTSFLVWFVENYPYSINIMNNDNQYQNKFKH